MAKSPFTQVILSLVRHKRQNSSVAAETIKRLLARPELLREEEREQIEFFAASLDQAGQLPSKGLFLQSFPDFEAEGIKLLLPEDAKIWALSLLKDRSKKIAAVQMVTLAESVSKDGFSSDSYQQLRDLYRAESSGVAQLDALVGLDGLREVLEEKKGSSVGMLTFVDALDNSIGGMEPERILIVAGAPGHFKTTLSVNIAYRNSYYLGYNCVYVSFEQGRDEIQTNLACLHSFDPKFDKYVYLPSRRITKVSLDDEEEAYLFDVVIPDYQNNSKGKLVILDSTDFRTLSYENIISRLEAISQQIGGIDAVFWDHLQLTKFNADEPSIKDLDERGKMNSFVSLVREMSFSLAGQKTLQVILSQTNRDGQLRAEKSHGVYDLRALSEANELERSAHWTVFTFANDSMKRAGEVRLCMPKNRSGPTIGDSTVVAQCEPEAYSISNLIGSYQPAGSGDMASLETIIEEDDPSPKDPSAPVVLGESDFFDDSLD